MYINDCGRESVQKRGHCGYDSDLQINLISVRIQLCSKNVNNIKDNTFEQKKRGTPVQNKASNLIII